MSGYWAGPAYVQNIQDLSRAACKRLARNPYATRLPHGRRCFLSAAVIF